MFVKAEILPDEPASGTPKFTSAQAGRPSFHFIPLFKHLSLLHIVATDSYPSLHISAVIMSFGKLYTYPVRSLAVPRREDAEEALSRRRGCYCYSYSYTTDLD